MPIRLYTDSPLRGGARVALGDDQSHYLRHVMRCREGDAVLLFNGRDGEWRAEVAHYGKRDAELQVTESTCPQTASPDLWLVFAPIKHGKIDFLAQKATELGVSRLQPVVTQHTAVSRVNGERLLANAIEASEQSGRLDVPQVGEPVALDILLASWPKERTLLYGDETGQGQPACAVLPPLKSHPLALLIGPEGGFSTAEHARLRTLPFVRGITLGPRVMRADTAALAALALTQALAGDWDAKPDFKATS